MNKDNYIWILGGGVMQLPMVWEAHHRGYKVLLSDRNKNCTCANIVEHFFALDVFDSEVHIAQAQSMSIKPSAIVVDAIDCGVTGAILADHYGLPTCGYIAALNAHDKVKMREALQAPHPTYLSLPIGTSTEDARKWWTSKANSEGIGIYPCVVKSSDNCASRGITVVKGVDDWERAISSATTNNRHSKFILVEECLSGDEVATDWFISNDDVVYANGAKRVFGDFGIEMGHTNPFTPTPVMVKQVSDAARALGVKYGPFKVDFIHDPYYGWVILETACRLSGGFDHTHTCPLATGKDVVGSVLDMALGLPLNRYKLQPRWDKHAACYAPRFKEGKIKGWRGLVVIRVSEGVEHAIALGGNVISPLLTCADRPIFVITKGNSEAEAWSNATRASEWIEPIYEVSNE